jgi:hypothetical protein
MIATLPALVYFLCFLTATLCAGLLVRSYLSTRSPVLLWSAACFVFLALTNGLVVVDRVLLPDFDLRTERLVLALMAVSVLLFGFIWEVEKD